VVTRRAVRGVVGAVVATAATLGLATACGSSSASAGPSATPTVSARVRPSAAPHAGASPSPAVAALAGPPYCGASQYVEEITLESWPNGAFRVSLRPTQSARDAANRDAVAGDMWQAIVRCVHPSAGSTDLGGTVGASLLDQLRCHEFFAQVPALDGGPGYATGPTFDLESWHPVAGESRWITSQCGNRLGTPPTGPESKPFRPDGVKPQYAGAGTGE
jgi:hypothetical protein